MEATGVVLMQPLRFPSSCGAVRPNFRELRFTSATNCAGPRRRVKSIGFRDQGHVRYYDSIVASPTAATGAKKLKKKQLKLLKGLFRDLAAFSHMSFGSESDADRVQGNMISEASELLLKQLEKVKAEEKQRKRKVKEEKARLKAAARTVSSGSSSSSDSECREIVDLKKQQVIDEATTLAYPVPIIPTAEPNGLDLEEELANESLQKSCPKKIQVCMGGKCKKSGAGALLEEFQKAIGVDGAVSGCKCMGKCRDGPNVKVSEQVDADISVRGSNSLCIGVGLEDVETIVANFLRGKDTQIGFGLNGMMKCV